MTHQAEETDHQTRTAPTELAGEAPATSTDSYEGHGEAPQAADGVEQPERASAAGPDAGAERVERTEVTGLPDRAGQGEPQDAVPSPRSEAALSDETRLPGPVPAPASAPEPESVRAAVSDPDPASEPGLASATALKPAPAPEAVPTSVTVSEPAPASGSQPPESALLPADAPESAPGHASGPATIPSPAPVAVPEATPAPEPHPLKSRRLLRATLRWTAALVVFAAVGAGTAYGIAGMERTDVPGLGTVSDGRWVYPTLTKPPLPKGSPGPLAEENKTGTHYADLRELVLPAPKGATADAALRGTDGWLATKDFLAVYGEKDDREELAQKFTEYGLRHIAARGWITPDGTHTRVYLLQFDTAAVVDELTGQIAPYGGPGYQLRGAADSVPDDAFPAKAQIEDIMHVVYTEAKPYGAEQTRHAYLAAGDVLALVIQDRKGAANPVPFQQTVTLQSQLLG
jgi:hypothetical protein